MVYEYEEESQDCLGISIGWACCYGLQVAIQTVLEIKLNARFAVSTLFPIWLSPDKTWASVALGIVCALVLFLDKDATDEPAIKEVQHS